MQSRKDLKLAHLWHASFDGLVLVKPFIIMFINVVFMFFGCIVFDKIFVFVI